MPSFANAFAVLAGPPPTTALRSVPSGIKSINTSPHTQTWLLKVTHPCGLSTQLLPQLQIYDLLTVEDH